MSFLKHLFQISALFYFTFFKILCFRKLHKTDLALNQFVFSLNQDMQSTKILIKARILALIFGTKEHLAFMLSSPYLAERGTYN